MRDYTSYWELGLVESSIEELESRFDGKHVDALRGENFETVIAWDTIPDEVFELVVTRDDGEIMKDESGEFYVVGCVGNRYDVVKLRETAIKD